MNLKENGAFSRPRNAVVSWRHPSHEGGSTDDLYDNEHDENASIQSLGYGPAGNSERFLHSGTGADDDEEDEEDATVVTEGGRAFQKLAWEETEAVNCAKISMALVLIGTAALFAVSIFFYARRRQEEEFDIQVRCRYLVSANILLLYDENLAPS